MKKTTIILSILFAACLANAEMLVLWPSDICVAKANNGGLLAAVAKGMV